MKKYALLLSLFLWPAGAWGQDIQLAVKGDGVSVVKVDKVITVKEDATLVSSFPFTISSPPGAGLYFWTVPAGVTFTDRGETIQITAASKGVVTVSVKAIGAKLDKDGKFVGFSTQFGSTTFNVGEVPGPTPPNPPTPPDPVNPAPIPAPGLRVLMVYETKDSGKLTAGQKLAMFGQTARDWLDANCVKDGPEPERRIWDKDVKLDGAPKLWKDAMARPRASVPWLIVSNGVSGFEGPMPETYDAIMTILTKYAGGKR